MASSQRANDDLDFADRTLVWFDKVCPGFAIVSAIFAGVLPFATTGAQYYSGYMLATIGSLLFVCDVMLCAACSTATILYRPQLRKSLRANGAGKVAINTIMLLVHVVFLTGLELYFVVMKMINSWLPGVIGIFITGFAIAVSISVWVVQLKTSDKGISLTEEE